MNSFFNKCFLLAMVFTAALMGCQKDYSCENGCIITYLASGSLQDAAGNCQNITVNGYYVKDSAVTASNFILVNVNFYTSGHYQLSTDTVNGCWFTMDSAYTYGGQQAIKLVAHGTPIVADTATVNVYFLGSTCSFSLVTTPLPPHISSETDYFPMTLGSYWVYDTMNNAGLRDTLHFVVSPLKQIFNGNNYTMFLSDHRDTNYYRKDTMGQYFNYNTAFSQYNFYFEYKILDDRLPVGSYWETPELSITLPPSTSLPSGGTLGVKMGCKITDKNVSMLLMDQTGSKTLDSVIKITESALIRNGPGPNDFYIAYTTNTAYAKKIGLIYYDAEATIPPIFRSLRNWYIQ